MLLHHTQNHVFLESSWVDKTQEKSQYPGDLCKQIESVCGRLVMYSVCAAVHLYPCG